MSQPTVALARVRARAALAGNTDALFAACLAAVAVLAGAALTVDNTLLALLLGAVLLLLLVATAPVHLAVLAVPGVLLIRRLGGAISMTDVLLVVAAAASLPALMRLAPSPALSRVRLCFALYVGTMTVVLAANPSARSAFDLLHRVVLVAGALAVGAWLAGEGRARIALSLLIHAAAVVSVFAVADSVRRGFEPAYPLGFHKNYIGSILIMSVLLLLLAPASTGVSVRRRLILLPLLLAGASACQSRGALVGGAVGLLVVGLITAARRGALRDRRRAVAAIVVALALGGGSYQLISAQLQDSTTNAENNSINARRDVEAYALLLWREAPLTGNGIRYFADPAFQARSRFVQPPNNMVDEALAEGGVVQAAGLVLFLGAALVVVGRSRHPLALAGLALLIARISHGMVDIYWTAGNTALPWMVVGMGLWLSDNAEDAPAKSQEPPNMMLSARSRIAGQA